jgi:hypothetical protein
MCCHRTDNTDAPSCRPDRDRDPSQGDLIHFQYGAEDGTAARNLILLNVLKLRASKHMNQSESTYMLYTITAS